MENLTTFFLPVSIWFQNLGNWLILPMQGITFLGNEFFYILVMPALYWCLSATLGIEIGIMLLISGSFNTLLKLVFYSPRPFWVSKEIQKLASGTSFGFPSGHAQNAASLWGLAAVKTKRIGIQLALIALIILIGFSRIVLGVHFFHDVLGGWLIGTLLLVFYQRFRDPFLQWFENYPRVKKVLIILSISSLFIVSGLLLTWRQTGNPLPADWLLMMETPADTASLEGIFSISAILFGMGSGLVLMTGSPQRLNAGTAVQKVIRYILGLTGVLVLYAGLGALFPEGRSALALGLRFVRYALIGGWISWWAPLMFDRLGLIPKQD